MSTGWLGDAVDCGAQAGATGASIAGCGGRWYGFAAVVLPLDDPAADGRSCGARRRASVTSVGSKSS